MLPPPTNAIRSLAITELWGLWRPRRARDDAHPQTTGLRREVGDDGRHAITAGRDDLEGPIDVRSAAERVRALSAEPGGELLDDDISRSRDDRCGHRIVHSELLRVLDRLLAPVAERLPELHGVGVVVPDDEVELWAAERSQPALELDDQVAA